MFLLKYSKIIDLRTTQEILKQGKIPNSKQIDLINFRQLLQNNQLNKDERILIYCWSGLRSKYALYLAEMYGYTNIEELVYGYKIFSKLGLKKYKEFI